MLTAEQTFFLTVLADHLNGRPTGPVSGLDWVTVYDMAEKHQLSALFYAQCGAFLPPEAELPFLRDYSASVADHAARLQITSEIDRAFTRHEIPYVIVKGPAVAGCYPQPELRTMGDVDVIVKEEDKEKARMVLLGLGFKSGEQGEHEWCFGKDSRKIELHHRLLYDEPANSPSAKTLADRIWEYARPVPVSSRCELDPSFHFLFLVMHLKKHVIYSGVGFRQFLDLAVTAQQWPLDRQKLKRWLTEVDLFLFARICLTLCRKWFLLESPLLPEEKLTPEFADETVQQIFGNGIFGSDDPSNADNNLMAGIEEKHGDSLRSRWQLCRKMLFALSSPELKKLPVRQFHRLLFPAYDYMRKLETCRFIDGRPWLLPAGWCWRFVLSGKFRIRRIVPVVFFSRKKIRERRKKLTQMGL